MKEYNSNTPLGNVMEEFNDRERLLLENVGNRKYTSEWIDKQSPEYIALLIEYKTKVEGLGRTIFSLLEQDYAFKDFYAKVYFLLKVGFKISDKEVYKICLTGKEKR